ncbi:MAG TPA: DUF1003 domain-containing protein [Acidimicrobiales bacterium]|nr:DUF1003 domain-containing protein [Acidimicrobiales bacterium]
MSKIYEYIRHPRAAELAHLHRPFRVNDLREPRSGGFLAKLNARVGLRVTLVVGTMWCAYLFTLLALVALPDAIKQGTYFIVVWLSSSFLQLVLLPIIIVGQNIQAAASDRRAEDTYKDAEAVLHEADEIQKHLLAQDEAITQIVELLAKLGGAPTSATN